MVTSTSDFQNLDEGKRVDNYQLIPEELDIDVGPQLKLAQFFLIFSSIF